MAKQLDAVALSGDRGCGRSARTAAFGAGLESLNDHAHIPKEPIAYWHCRKCNTKVRAREDVKITATLAKFGPNGNGWNYWHMCRNRLEPMREDGP